MAPPQNNRNENFDLEQLISRKKILLRDENQKKNKRITVSGHVEAHRPYLRDFNEKYSIRMKNIRFEPKLARKTH